MIKKVVLFLIFLSLFYAVYGEEIFIQEIDVSVTGVTNKQSLLRVAELSEGQVFASVKGLEDILLIVKNKLDDARLFKSVEVSAEYLPSTDRGTPAIVRITVVDSWNIIALPYPKYDSNDGFEFSLRARDYNFLGLMEPLRLNLNYQYDENQKHNYEAALTYAVNFPICDHNFNLSFSQGFNYSPEDSYGDDFFMNSGASLGTSYTLPWDIYDGNHVRYSISTSVSKDYIPFHTISDSRDEIELGFSHGLSLGQTSWDGNNYRDGISFSLSNSFSYDIELDYCESPAEAWDGSVSGKVQFHKDMYPLGYSGRVGMVQDLKGYSNIEGPFRGILSSEDLTARRYAYFNNALYITVWNNRNFWEIMGGPCLDIGYMWDVPKGQDNIAWSIAVDGLCYPAFAKSFQARITIGMSGNGFMETEGEAFSRVRKNLEMFFGLGKFF